MREKVVFYDDGFMALALAAGESYIMTKWYGRSVAIFKEPDFQRYISHLDKFVKERDHGSSVIRYFLSAAVTMLVEENGMWQMPEVLFDFIKVDDSPIVSETCLGEGIYKDSWPMLILAADSAMDAAMQKTEAHKKDE